MNSAPRLGPLDAGPVAEAGRGRVFKGAPSLPSAGSGSAPPEGGEKEVDASGGGVGTALAGRLSRLAATGWGRGGRGAFSRSRLLWVPPISESRALIGSQTSELLPLL